MFLLDTSVVSQAVNPGSSKYDAVQLFLQQNPPHVKQRYLCAVTIAEAAFGLNLLKLRQTSAERIDQVTQRIAVMSKMGEILTIDRHVAHDHARLRASYARVRLPNQVKSGARLKSKHVELWHESVPASQLQITENDLWIAATAITYDLVLVTADADHEQLSDAMPELRVQKL